MERHERRITCSSAATSPPTRRTTSFASRARRSAPSPTSRARCSIIPGNHDLLYAERRPRRTRFEQHFGHLLETDLPEYRAKGVFPFVHFVGDEAAVVGLSSARLPLSRLRARAASGGAAGRRSRSSSRTARMRHRAMHRDGPPCAAHRRSGRPDSRIHGLTDGGRAARAASRAAVRARARAPARPFPSSTPRPSVRTSFARAHPHCADRGLLGDRRRGRRDPRGGAIHAPNRPANRLVFTDVESARIIPPPPPRDDRRRSVRTSGASVIPAFAILPNGSVTMTGCALCA